MKDILQASIYRVELVVSPVGYYVHTLLNVPCISSYLSTCQAENQTLTVESQDNIRTPIIVLLTLNYGISNMSLPGNTRDLTGLNTRDLTGPAK